MDHTGGPILKTPTNREKKYIYIYIYSIYKLHTYIRHGVRGVWVKLLGGQGGRARVILVLCEYIWNAPAVSLVLPAFDDAGSLGSPLH